MLSRRRTWLGVLAVNVVVAVAGIYSDLSALGMDVIEIPWRLAALSLAGPGQNAPMIVVIGWLMMPASFLVGAGEPFSALARAWMRMALVRTGNRCVFWFGRLLAHFLVGALFVGAVFLIRWVVAGIVVSATSPSVPAGISIAGLEGHAGLALGAWIGANVLAAVWWVTGVRACLSVYWDRPGIPTVVTLFVAYTLTVLGTRLPAIVRYGRPLVGARLNASMDGLTQADWIGLILLSVVWIGSSVGLGYSRLRKCDL